MEVLAHGHRETSQRTTLTPGASHKMGRPDAARWNQYSSGSRIEVSLRSDSVMIQNFTPFPEV